MVEKVCGEPALARQYWRELVAIQPGNLRAALLALFNLAIEAADPADALGLVNEMGKVEGEEGAYWRFAVRRSRLTRFAAATARPGNQVMTISAIFEAGVQLAEKRPDWWGAPLLQAEIAELEGHDDEIVAAYQRVIDLGNFQPVIVRRLIGILSNQERFDDIDALITRLRERGIAAQDLAIATAYGAIRQKNYDLGLPLARSLIPASSTRHDDHLALGRILFSSGKAEEAGKEFRRALAPSVPQTWLSWVEYLAPRSRPPPPGRPPRRPSRHFRGRSRP